MTTEHKVLRREKTVPMSAMAVATSVSKPIAEAAKELRSELLEEATLLNAEGWQSGEISASGSWEQPWNGSVLVVMRMEMFRNAN